jgi:glycosyltransferase involved in cell wall biosynthesis
LNSSNIAIIIPVFNEEPHIVQEVLDTIPIPYKVYLVDDGSVISLSGLKHPSMVSLRLEENKGQGYALSYGIKKAVEDGNDFFCTMDADGQHLFTDLERLLEPVMKGDTDVVIGSRFKGGSDVPFFKKIMLKMGTKLHYLLFGIQTSDTHNGLRAFNRNSAKLFNFSIHRMGHASEILDIIVKNKLRFKEMAVSVTYSKYAKRKGQKNYQGFAILWQLVKYKLGVYKNAD